MTRKGPKPNIDSTKEVRVIYTRITNETHYRLVLKAGPVSLNQYVTNLIMKDLENDNQVEATSSPTPCDSDASVRQEPKVPPDAQVK